MTPALTPRQERILAAIVAAVRETGYPPSMRELAAASSTASTSSVAYNLAKLAALGLIELIPYGPHGDMRRIRLLHRSGEPCPVCGAVVGLP